MLKKIKPKDNFLLHFEKEDKKYLSPSIFLNDDTYYMLYCRRKSSKSLNGEINYAISDDLISWKKIYNITLKPERFFGSNSYVSPNLFYFKENFFLFVEAQYHGTSKIFYTKSKTINKWPKEKKFIFDFDNKLFQSPFLFEIDNKPHLFYSENQCKINCAILDDRFNITEIYNCLSAELENERYSIYSPSIIKHGNTYYMFYAAWGGTNIGNINIAISKDAKKWEKLAVNIFELNNAISIISEPYAIKKNNEIYIFYEFKKHNYWNINFVKFETNILNT